MSEDVTLNEFTSNSNPEDEWTEKTIKNLIQKDEAGVWGNEPADGGVRVLRATNYEKNNIDLSDVAIRHIPESKKESKKLTKGDIVVERSGGSANQPVGRVLFFDLEGEYYCTNFLRQLRPNTSEVNPRYLYYHLDYDYKRGQTKSLQTNTTNIRNLQYASYLNQKVPIAPLSEQRKIATVLHTVDQAIQKTEEIIEQIRRVKTGIQQELFTEGYYDHNSFVETRVGTLPESWRLEKVKNYTELVSGAHVKSDLVSDDSSLTPYLTGPDDFDELGFTVTKYTDEPTKFCEAGDTLITVKGSGCGKSTFANQRACISRQLKAIRPSDGLEELYLFYFLETKQTLLENLAEGSAIPGLSNSHLTALDIPVPSTEEQHGISETLKVYDNGIVQEKNYKSQLQRFKKGLMQDLLSGEVRTTDTDIHIPEEVAKYG